MSYLSKKVDLLFGVWGLFARWLLPCRVWLPYNRRVLTLDSEGVFSEVFLSSPDASQFYRFWFSIWSCFLIFSSICRIFAVSPCFFSTSLSYLLESKLGEPLDSSFLDWLPVFIFAVERRLKAWASSEADRDSILLISYSASMMAMSSLSRDLFGHQSFFICAKYSRYYLFFSISAM